MKETKRRERPKGGRRRFLGLLGWAGAGSLALPLLSGQRGPRERDLREADFYRPHDLAG